MVHINNELSVNEVNWASSQPQGQFIITEKPKKTKETISFWNEAPMFQSSLDYEVDADHINKFVIEKIESKGPKKKILYGHKQIAVVEGIFAETAFRVGQRVSVLPCICCLKSEKFNEKNNFYKSINTDNPSQKPHKTKLITFHIDDENNTILIEDDVLTVTSFCTAQDCINNPLLKSTVAEISFEFGHPSLVIGIIIHELIQSSFINKTNTFDFLATEAKRIIKEHYVLLYSCNISDKEALNEVLKNLKNILKLINSNFNIEAIEHRVYSPFYGLKGSIDCLDNKYVIEIKTGKHMNNQHRSQVILYTILTMEQRLKNKINDYENFLCSTSVYQEITDIKVLDDLNLSNAVLTQDKATLATTNFDVLSPLLYYVNPGDFVKVKIEHEEIVYLMRTRNDIASNKHITPCSCPENYVCSILNKIKALDTSHFLRKQYDDIELEANRTKKYLRCVKVSQDRNRVVYKVNESVMAGEFYYIYTTNLKYVAMGVIESSETSKITIELRDPIETDKIIMISMDNENNSLKYMRWALVNAAYLKFLRKDSLGKGIDSFLLPGQEYGLEVKEPVQKYPNSTSFDEIEFNDFDSEPGGSVVDKTQNTCGRESYENNTNANKTYIKNTIDRNEVNETSSFSLSSLISEKDFVDVSDVEIRRGLLDIFDSEASNDYLVLKSGCSNDSFNIESDFSDDVDLINKHTEVQAIEKVDSGNQTLLSLENSKPKVLFNNFEITDSFQCFTAPSKSNCPSYKYCIPELYKEEFLRLNEDQRMALFTSLNCQNYRIVHGMPGTGKSTMIALLIRILIYYNQKVLLICYTHLAIQNIIDKIGSVYYYKAKKQEFNFDSYSDTVKAFTKPDLVVGTCYSFNDPVYIKKRFDFCIIDEGSQMHLLLSLIPIQISDKFCIVGDHLQLKPLCKKAKNLSLSLFEHLIEDCSVLTHQYRMGDEIMKLSNTMFYNNKLIGFGGTSTVNFIDSENISLYSYIKSLKSSTVLCYFNSKVKEIQQINKEITVTTIDRFQGSEADEILVVFDPVEKCSVIESRERLNVALTRAKKKLVLLGNKKEMCNIPLFEELLMLL